MVIPSYTYNITPTAPPSMWGRCVIHREATRAGTDGPEMPVPATAQYGIIMGYEGMSMAYINIYIYYYYY